MTDTALPKWQVLPLFLTPFKPRMAAGAKSLTNNLCVEGVSINIGPLWLSLSLRYCACTRCFCTSMYFYCLAELRTWQKVLAGRAAGTRAPPPESPGQTCARIKQHGSNSATSICLPRPCPSDPPAPCRVTSKCSKMLAASPAMA